MTPRSTTRTAVGAALVGLVFTLTACDSSPDGKFYNDEGQLVIDGSNVQYFPFVCPSDESGTANGDPAYLSEEPDAEGKLSDDRGQVMWTTEDGHISGSKHDAVNPGDTEPITFGDDGDMVAIERLQFQRMEKKDALEAFAQGCADDYQADQERQAGGELRDGAYYGEEILAYQPGSQYATATDDTVVGRIVVLGGKAYFTRFKCDGTPESEATGSVEEDSMGYEVISWPGTENGNVLEVNDGVIETDGYGDQYPDGKYYPEDNPDIAEALANREKGCGAFPQD